MARNTDPKCKQCRREGEKLFLKGEKCLSERCPFDRRSYAPGQHGARSGQRMSDFAIHLREKQKLRRTYGVLEGQFRLIYAEAARRRGATGEVLLQLLESRLDCVAYRMGFGASRAAARQVVRHNGVLVNGRRTNIPSYRLKPGDEVALTERMRKTLTVDAALESAKSKGFPDWLSMDVSAGKGVFKQLPVRDELPPTINENLVVELYSK